MPFLDVLRGGGGRDWQRLKNSDVRSWDVIVIGLSFLLSVFKMFSEVNECNTVQYLSCCDFKMYIKSEECFLFRMVVVVGYLLFFC